MIAPDSYVATNAAEAFRDLAAVVRETNLKNGWTGSRDLVAERDSEGSAEWISLDLNKRIVQHQIVEIALIMTEASEAIEELRAGRRADEAYWSGGIGYAEDDDLHWSAPTDANGAPRKPEGVPSEIADVVIRCLDFADAWGIDLGDAVVEKINYNATRGFRHGGKAA